MYMSALQQLSGMSRLNDALTGHTPSHPWIVGVVMGTHDGSITRLPTVDVDKQVSVCGLTSSGARPSYGLEYRVGLERGTF